VKHLSILLGALSFMMAAPYARAEEFSLVETPAPAAQTNRLQSMWRFELGYRGTFVKEAAFDPFSTQDYFGQVSVGFSRTVYAKGRFSFAPGFAWDFGRSGATARGDGASLDVHRLVVPLEGRMHFGKWGYTFVRAAPGIAFEAAEVDDAASPTLTSGGTAPLTKSRWLFATDLSAGYAYPLWPRENPTEFMPRVWIQADGGYSWIAPLGLNLAPDLPSSDPRMANGVDLGALTMRGAFFRVSAAVSF
jgi:hypothetical protein